VNRTRPRHSVKSLAAFCYKYAPAHLYMSILEWLMPERVKEKRKSNRAYPMGGEFVVDVDSMNVWIPHDHYYLPDNLCLGCLESSPPFLPSS